MTSNPLIQPITRNEELSLLIQEIHASTEVCLDTEADSLHHYFEKICLLQFTLPRATRDEDLHFLVDPLAKLDLNSLFAVLKDKPLILHGSDYDLRMLKSSYDFIPCKIFDTMLAARLAGHQRLGLDGLVKHYFGKDLDHKAQKADWSIRPLPDNLLIYAVDDTRHLPLITQKLREELTALGRHQWHEQQCQQLIVSCTTPSSKEATDPWRIKGSFDLPPQNLAILRELWKWRDEEAKSWDRPSFMVCNNEKLIELTEWAVKTPNGHLSTAPQLPLKRWRPQRTQALIAALKRGWNLPQAEWPAQAPRGKRPAFQAHFLPNLNKLKAAREQIAKEINMEPSLLASNSIMEAIAGLNPTKLEDFQKIEKWLPWQSEVLGKRFLTAISAASPQASQ